MSDKTAATGREIVTKALLAEGAGPGASIHSWRCEHPDRYGPCDCVEQAASVVVDALAQAGYGDVRALLHDLRGLLGALHGLADAWDEPGQFIERGVIDHLRVVIHENEAALLARHAPSDHTPPANDQENP